MHQVLLAGAYGQANPGDEALLEAFLDHLDPSEVVVTSQTPAETAERWGCAAIAPSGLEVARWMQTGRHLVIGGGTIFKALHPSSGRRRHSLLLKTFGLVRAAKMRGISVSLVGVGAADLPSATGRRLAHSIAHHSNLLVVRDEESTSVLADAGVAMPIRVGADPAWVLFDDQLQDAPPPRSSTPNGDGHPRILVALSHLAGGPGLGERLAESLNQIDPSGRSITLQPWQQDERSLDHQLAHEMASAMGNGVTIAPPPRDLRDAVTQVGEVDLVVGLRFHALVAAAVAGTRFVAVAHEPKLAGLAARFSQLALPAHASAPVLAKAITTAVDRPAPDRAIAVDEAARAAEGFRLLRLILTDGASLDDQPRARLTLSTGGARW